MPETDQRERLIELRRLLDTGVIGGREFDRRRKELLGLPSAFEAADATGVGDSPPKKVAIRVDYELGRGWFGVVFLLGAGAFIAWSATPGYESDGLRALLAFIAAAAVLWGVVMLVGLIRLSLSHEPALAIDRAGFSARLPLKGRVVRYRVPWSEVEECSVKESEGEYFSSRWVELKLRAPTLSLRLPPREPHGYSRRHRRLRLPTSLMDTSADDLASLIQSQLEEATDTIAERLARQRRRD